MNRLKFLVVFFWIFGCSGSQLTPDQVAAINLCEQKVWTAATSQNCLGQVLSPSGGSIEGMVLTCAIRVAIDAVPACAQIIPTFLTIKTNKDIGTFGASKYPTAEEQQQTIFGKALKDHVADVLNK